MLHGMGEHSGRYDRAAQALTRAGYQVYASDHLGHGQTVDRPEDLGYFGEGRTWTTLVDDVHALNRQIASQHPNLPRVILGHSFGSFIAQHYLMRYGDTLHAAVLSGTNTGDAFLVHAGRGLAMVERLRVGPRGVSQLLQMTTVTRYNLQFYPTRTSNDWLSRDPVAVDAFEGDPLCGLPLRVQSWIEFLSGVLAIEDRAGRARIPKDLPIYLFAGSRDPVGNNGKGPTKLAAAYERVGLRRVSCKLYPDARHEMLNETNRDEVTADLIAWLDANAVSAAS
jgi:alpha-beta hydrolase superfamily lysophospholipase